MASVFTRIINGELPSYKVHETDEFIAFLDIRPLHAGHTLVVPKVEIDYVFNLPSDILGRYFQYSQSIAKAIEKVVDCERIGVAVIGLEVPHAHIHLVPIHGVHDLDFSKKPVEVAEEEMQRIAKRIGGHVEL